MIVLKSHTAVWAEWSRMAVRLPHIGPKSMHVFHPGISALNMASMSRLSLIAAYTTKHTEIIPEIVVCDAFTPVNWLFIKGDMRFRERSQVVYTRLLFAPYGAHANFTIICV
jgi:hypothetical protein